MTRRPIDYARVRQITLREVDYEHGDRQPPPVKGEIAGAALVSLMRRRLQSTPVTTDGLTKSRSGGHSE